MIATNTYTYWYTYIYIVKDTFPTYFFEWLPDSVGCGIVERAPQSLQGRVDSLSILGLEVTLVWCLSGLGSDGCKVLKHPEKLYQGEEGREGRRERERGTKGGREGRREGERERGWVGEKDR